MTGKGRERILCSTGTFIGRINGRDHRLLAQYGDQIRCGGFEVMVSGDWYDRLDEIIRDIQAAGFRCPVVHADKQIGDLISEGADNYLSVWRENCRFAEGIGASKIVVHAWGLPDSNRPKDMIVERCGMLLDVAEAFGLDLLVENVPCSVGSPVRFIEMLSDIFPRMGFIIDTRLAHYHGELENICQSPLWRNGKVRHIHMSDCAGDGPKEDMFRHILTPGGGAVDFPMFFKHLRAHYHGDVTLEGPAAHRADGVNTAALNAGLDYIAGGLQGEDTI